MFECPKCGAKSRDGVLKCPDCGFVFSELTEDVDDTQELLNHLEVTQTSDQSSPEFGLQDTVDFPKLSSTERAAAELNLPEVNAPSSSSVSKEELADTLEFPPRNSGASDVVDAQLVDLNVTLNSETDLTWTGDTLDRDVQIAVSDTGELNAQAESTEPMLEEMLDELGDSLDGSTTDLTDQPILVDGVLSDAEVDQFETVDLDKPKLDSADSEATLELGESDANAKVIDNQETVDFDAPLLPLGLGAVGHLARSNNTDNEDTLNYDTPTPDQTEDLDFTLDLSKTSSPDDLDGTARYTDEELAAARTETGRSGSEGRLKRIWHGAGGSTGSPMRTLKGSAALASESIFDRVSVRVLVSDSIQEIISTAEKRAKKDKEKERSLVKHCIETACSSDRSSLPDYQINGYLGKGAMGVVLQARQVAIGRDVALKMIQPSSDGSRSASSTRDMHKKFLYEAQITGKLDHPNIVPVYELGMSNEVLFYAMKKIVGTEWKSTIVQLSRDENLDIFMKICDAMAFSHLRDVIHRDLKPENVMLGPFGEVLVTDWGCAVDLSLRESFTGAGSPPWMAPEMALQQHSKVRSQSDIYLLGAILFQIITGHPPHPGRTVMEVLLAASRNQIVLVEESDPLLTIALRAMETQPKDRYATVEAMQADIREYRRHSESIALAERSQLTLDQAVDSKDYERFSRSIFGFQDALGLWPENESASTGLLKARYAYGQCAYERKDYDLCLATLDRSQADEDNLYQQAENAKQAAQLRENRLKTLRKAFAAAILIGLATSSLLAGVAWLQRNEAVSQKQIAEKSAAAEKVARQSEELAKVEAIGAKVAAEKSAESEKLAKNEAISAKEAAEQSAEREKLAKLEEEKAKDSAILAQKDAERAAQKEKEAKEETEERTAQVELAGLQSNLALSLGQIEQLDAARGGELLESLANPNNYKALASKNQLPRLKTWAWHRVHLLSNRDLLQEPWGQSLMAMAYTQQADAGVVAISSGDKNRLQIIRPDHGRMTLDPENVLDIGKCTVEGILISPDASHVVYSVVPVGDQPTVSHWNLATGRSKVLSKVDSRSMQGFTVSSDATVAGLNNGLWIWDNGDLEQEPRRIAELSGKLMSIQMIDDDHALVLAQMASGERFPHLISLSNPEQRLFLRVQDALQPARLSAIAHANGRLILGTDAGKMYSMQLDARSLAKGQGRVTDAGVSVDKESLIELPQQHISRVKRIQSHPDGTLLSVAEEPLVNLWKVSDAPAGWKHELRLTGAISNVTMADFISDSDHVIAFSEDARSIVWDAAQHRRRQQIQRLGPDGRSAEGYDAPVVQIISSMDQPHAVSILENGRIDRWNIRTGVSLHQTDVPLAYVGHDPEAQFADFAIDQSAGVLITSARLPNRAKSASLVSTDQSDNARQELTQWDWEFVKWDLRQGSMLDRWTRRSSEEQAISLSHEARYVLYGSDIATRLQEPKRHATEFFVRDDFGSSFGTVHPKSSNQMMLVKLNGTAIVVDTNDPKGSWRRPGHELSELDFFKIATKDDRLVTGQWSPRGDRYYLIWDSGRVTELRWENNRLAVGRDLFESDQRLDLSLTQQDSSSSRKASETTSNQSNLVRLGSRWNIDLKVRAEPGFDLLYAVVRFPGVGGLARFTRIAFPQPGGEIIRDHNESLVGRQQFVLTDDDTPRLESDSLRAIQKRLPGFAAQIVGTRSVGSNTYAVTKNGTVYRVYKQHVSVFGRPKLVSGTGDRSGNVIVTLHQGGILWRGDWKVDNWQWRQLEMASSDASQIALSPDGRELLITTAKGPQLVSADSGLPLVQLANPTDVVISSWSPSKDASLAVVLRNGEVHEEFNGQSKLVGRLSGRQAVSLHFCHEAWNDPQRPTSRWLVVRCRSGEGGSSDELVYLSLDQENAAERSPLKLPSNASAIEFSPTEGLLAIGGQGTLAVYLTAPSLNEPGKELYSLPGHAGAEVHQLRFTQDGNTLISADTNHRLLGWLSQDSPTEQ